MCQLRSVLLINGHFNDAVWVVMHLISLDHYAHGFSQWETTLHCNVVIGLAHTNNDLWIYFRNIFPFRSVHFLSLRWNKVDSKAPLSQTVNICRAFYATGFMRDVVMTWAHFSPYWPFVTGIRRSLVVSPHRGQVMPNFVICLVVILKKDVK